MPFQKGNCYNPDGRPKGSKNKSTIARDKLVDILVERMDEAKVLAFKDFYKGVIQLLPKESKIELETEAINIHLSDDRGKSASELDGE